MREAARGDPDDGSGHHRIQVAIWPPEQRMPWYSAVVSPALTVDHCTGSGVEHEEGRVACQAVHEPVFGRLYADYFRLAGHRDRVEDQLFGWPVYDEQLCLGCGAVAAAGGADGGAADQVTVGQRLEGDAAMAGQEVVLGGQQRLFTGLEVVDTDAASGQTICSEAGHHRVFTVRMDKRGSRAGDIRFPLGQHSGVRASCVHQLLALFLAQLNSHDRCPWLLALGGQGAHGQPVFACG